MGLGAGPRAMPAPFDRVTTAEPSLTIIRRAPISCSNPLLLMPPALDWDLVARGAHPLWSAGTAIRRNMVRSGQTGNGRRSGIVQDTGGADGPRMHGGGWQTVASVAQIRTPVSSNPVRSAIEIPSPSWGSELPPLMAFGNQPTVD